jgi:hypothetical protein
VVADKRIEIPKIELQFRAWSGTPIVEDFGRKPLIDFGGRPVFAELCVHELFRLSGWESRWVETYGASPKAPYFFTEWRDVPLQDQICFPIGDETISALLQNIMTVNRSSFVGCWDIIGWFGDTVVFAELKRRKKDKIRATQPQWLKAALQIGLRPENFLLVEWDFQS